MSDESQSPYFCINMKPYNFSAEAPLFIKFECTVRVSKEDATTFPVAYIPSCVLNILELSGDTSETINLG